MEEDLGMVFVDGKMYDLKNLSLDELKDLVRRLEGKEKKHQKRIVQVLKK